MEPENDRDQEISANYKKMMGEDEIAQKAFGEIRDPAIKGKLETDLRQRLGQWYDKKKELGGAEEDFTLRGKHRPLAEQLSIDIDRIVGGAVKANGGIKGQQKVVDQKKEYAEKLRDDLKAKMPQGHQQDHDRER